MKLHYIWSMVWSFWRQLHWSLRLQAWRTQIYQVSNAYNFLIFSLYNTYPKKKKKVFLVQYKVKDNLLFYFAEKIQCPDFTFCVFSGYDSHAHAILVCIF